MSIGRAPGRLPTLFGNGAGARNGSGRRHFVGLRIASGCRAAMAALVSAAGRGLAAELELVGAESVAAGEAAVDSYWRLTSGAPQTPGEAAQLALSLSNVAAELVGRLLGSSSPTAKVSLAQAAAEVLLLAVYEPGLWHVGRADAPGCLALCDAGSLAERTGLNVVDAFWDRDLACGGHGGPLLAVPLWMLLSDERQTRLLLDLGRTVRLTYLPARQANEYQPRVLSFDVGPGTVLPDTLAEQFTGGEYEFDPGGTLAVQGRRIAHLIDHWLADPYFHKPPPRWYPLGVRPEAELQSTVHMAIESGWTIRDLLCTATHFIAESIARTCRTMLPQSPPIGEILLTGGGAQNGFLLSEIARRLPEIPLRMAADVCAGGEGLEAAATAALGLLFVDQVPANQPAVTGTKSPRVLGRLSAGSPARWRRLMAQLAESTEYRSPAEGFA